MGEVSNGVEEKPSQQQATAAPVPPSAAPDVDDARSPDSADKTGAAAAGQEPSNKEAETAEAAEVAGATVTQAEKPTLVTNVSSPATPPETTPERDTPLPPAEEHAHVDTVKPEGGTTPPPPPPAHDSEGSDTRSADGHGSPLRDKPKKPAGASGRQDVAASNSKSRLLTFRSFTRDKKANKSGDAATPEGRVPLSPVHGKAGEDGAEHKGKERRKRFWK